MREEKVEKLWWIDLIPSPHKERRLFMRVLADKIWTCRKEILAWKLRQKHYKRQKRLTPEMEEYIKKSINDALTRKRRAEKELGDLVIKHEALWKEWARLVIGLSPHLVGRIIAIIYTPLRFKHPSQLWAYVNDCVERRTQYSRRLKSILYDVVTVFRYQKHPFYYRLYNWAKMRELKKGTPKWLADLRAMRVVRKVFVCHLFEVWYPLDADLVGLKVNIDQIKPYSVAYLGHTWIRAQEVINWKRDIEDVLGKP